MAFRSFVPFGRQAVSPFAFYPFQIEGDPPLGDGTEYIMACDAQIAADHNWGWNLPLERATFSIDSFTIGGGGTFTDSQMPMTLVYVNADFGNPYTPEAPGPDFSEGGPDSAYDTQLGPGYIEPDTEAPLTDGRIYLGTLPDAVYKESIDDYVDAFLYGRIERIYNIQPVHYQDPNDRVFFSKSSVRYTLLCWLEADIPEQITQLISGISFLDGSDYVWPLDSNPEFGFIEVGGTFESVTIEGAPNVGEIVLPDDLSIQLYETSNQESGGGASIARSFIEAELEVQRWGPRTPL